jgi:hypothetical protein
VIFYSSEIRAYRLQCQAFVGTTMTRCDSQSLRAVSSDRRRPESRYAGGGYAAYRSVCTIHHQIIIYRRPLRQLADTGCKVHIKKESRFTNHNIVSDVSVFEISRGYNDRVL